MELNIDLSHIKEVINHNFYPLLFNTKPYLILRGGAGSGKSVFCAQKLILRILMDYNKPLKHRFIAFKKTAPYARKSLFPLFKRIITEWGLMPLVTIHKTSMVFTFSNGSSIEVMGLDDSEKVKSIEGVTGIFMEELTEFNRNDYLQLDLRMRGNLDVYYQILGAFNPISKTNWVYNEFFLNSKNYGDTLTTHLSTYKDNRFLDEAYKEKLNSLGKRDLQWYKIYCLGEWGSLENLIYKDNWTTIDAIPQDVEEAVIGLDFGYQHPNAATGLGFGNDKVYIKELLYKSKQTISQLIRDLKEILPRDPNALFNRRTIIYCDSARPEAIQQMRNEGLNAHKVIKGKNSVREGIDLVKQQDLVITKDSINIINEIEKYRWREDRNGVVLEEPFKEDDDACDSIRYGIYMKLGRKQEFGALFASI